MTFKTATGFSLKRKAVAVFFVLFVMGLILYFRSLSQPISASTLMVLDYELQNHIDSLKAVEPTKTIYPFNPNFITDQRGYFLDLTPDQIDRLHSYRAQGKWINSTHDFQRVTGVDSLWLSKYSFFFNFPIFTKKVKVRSIEKSYPTIDLNTATATELRKIYGIGEVFSKRTINYRKSLKGYSIEDQLSEVYGLSPTLVMRLQARCSIITKPHFSKISLQQVSLEELTKLPYISYAEARKIISLRTRKREITLSNLHSIKGFDSLKIERLTLYLF